MKTSLTRLFPWAVVVIVGVWMVSPVFRPQPEALALIGGLPVLDQGRSKPLDTVARNTLLAVSKKQTFVDQDGKRQPAIVWLLDHMSGSERATKHKIVRIEHQGVLDLLGLKEEGGSFRYSLDEVLKNRDALLQAIRSAEKKEQAHQALYDRKVLELARRLQTLQHLRQAATPALIPPVVQGGSWQSLSQAVAAEREGKPASPELDVWRKVINAWLKADQAALLEAAHTLSAGRVAMDPGLASHANWERLFHKSDVFYQAMLGYLLAFLLVAFGWLGWAEPLNKAATRLAVFTLVIHTVALVARMTLHGRPPVTNLYSSAIFVGWGAVVAALILERIFKSGIGTATGSAVGAASLLVAHHLAGDGDTMEMMRAVLDTNFWLATHVTTITIGYSANFLAGFLAAVFVVRGVLTPSLDHATLKNINRMIYGTLAFATLFSFVGTVLGGIWADQSWGRFWGWDPKENGALLIVLWDAMALHARWGGMVRARGLAIIALLGNVVTAWSWFGVNMLGVGLHSYGFTDGAARALGLFVLGNLLLVALASVPTRYWRSGGGPRRPATPAA